MNTDQPLLAGDGQAVITCLGRALGLRGMSGEPPPGAIDWPAFLETASSQGVLAWLDLGLRSERAVPEFVREATAAERLRVAQRNMLLAGELARVVRSLQGASIDVIAFKGPVAAVQLHGDFGHRPSGDIDLLVHKRAWDRAAAVLVGLGYQHAATHEDALQGSFYEPESTTKVDLHWGIAPVVYPLNERPLWQASTTLELIASSIPTFAVQDAIAIAAINLLKEHWQPKLHPVVDVAAGLAQLDAAGWRALRRRARMLRCERVVLAAGNVCWRLFGESFARELIDDCAVSEPANVFGTEILSRLFLDAAATAYASRRDASMLGDSAMRVSLHKFKVALSPTEFDTAFVRLPRQLRLLYFLVRPVRLIWKRLARQVQRF